MPNPKAKMKCFVMCYIQINTQMHLVAHIIPIFTNIAGLIKFVCEILNYTRRLFEGLNFTCEGQVYE